MLSDHQKLLYLTHQAFNLKMLWQFSTGEIQLSYTETGHSQGSLYFWNQPHPLMLDSSVTSRLISGSCNSRCKWPAGNFPSPQSLRPIVCWEGPLLWRVSATVKLHLQVSKSKHSQHCLGRTAGPWSPLSRRASSREAASLTSFICLFSSRVLLCFDWRQSPFYSTATSGHNLIPPIYGCLFHAGCVSVRGKAWFREEAARQQHQTPTGQTRKSWWI